MAGKQSDQPQMAASAAASAQHDQGTHEVMVTYYPDHPVLTMSSIKFKI
jgi:hypothetical protein